MLDLVQTHTQLQNIHKITFNLYMDSFDLKMLHVNDNLWIAWGAKFVLFLFYYSINALQCQH